MKSTNAHEVDERTLVRRYGRTVRPSRRRKLAGHRRVALSRISVRLRYGEPVTVGKNSVQFDEAAWPFVVVAWPPRTLTDHEFSAGLTRIASYFERGERFGLIMDIREAPLLSAERRRQVAEHIDQRQHLGRLVGIAIVPSSPLHRGIMNAVNWLRQHKDPPSQGVRDVAAGLAWLRQIYRAEAAEVRE